jgi:hypothetical protein
MRRRVELLLVFCCALGDCASINRATPNGATPNGAASNRATSNRATSNRATSNGATSNGLDRISLPEDKLATIERLERILQPGMPIEEAQQLLEGYGFRCRYEETVGVPYLYGVQVKERHRWPFRGVWSATVYHKDGIVTRIQGNYELTIVERGIMIPPLHLDRFPAARGFNPLAVDSSRTVRKQVRPKTERAAGQPTARTAGRYDTGERIPSNSAGDLVKPK